MMKNPIEIMFNGRLFRQVFQRENDFFILPGKTSERIVTYAGLALPVVEIKDKIGPFSSKQLSHYIKPPAIEELVYNALANLMMDNPYIMHMNGLLFLEAKRTGMFWLETEGELSRIRETFKFDLMRYELTDRILFTTLTPEEDFEKPYKL